MFSISTCTAEQVRDLLKTHEAYKDSSVHIFYQEVDINDVYFLSNYIRLEKYRQIKVLFDLYKNNQIPLFEPLEIKLLEDKSSIVTPIILERHQEKLYVIEGKTRLKYAYQHGISKLNVIVINGVKSDLPVVKGFEPKRVSQVMVTDNKKAENMQCVKLFRHIEEMFHPSDTYLM